MLRFRCVGYVWNKWTNGISAARVVTNSSFNIKPGNYESFKSQKGFKGSRDFMSCNYSCKYKELIFAIHLVVKNYIKMQCSWIAGNIHFAKLRPKAFSISLSIGQPISVLLVVTYDAFHYPKSEFLRSQLAMSSETPHWRQNFRTESWMFFISIQ